MPDTLNKQSLINLLIDSPLREPIKINLIDIINNTSENDLPKVYGTITKELEIFQKATERRMKLAEETIAKLGGVVNTSQNEAPPAQAVTPQSEGLSVPPLDLPPLPTPPKAEPSLPPTPAPDPAPPVMDPLPPMPPAPESPTTPQPLGTTTDSSSDEDALAQIQKELDSLKTETAEEVAVDAATPAPASSPAPTPTV